MNTNLLLAIRLSKKRLVPAIKIRKKSNPSLEFLMRWVRVFTALKDIPVKSIQNKKYYLDAFPKPNSKAFAVIDELTQTKIVKSDLFIKSERQLLGKELARLSYYGILTLPTLFRLLKRKTNLNEVDVHVVIGYVAYKRFLNKNKNLIPIIISDITPTSHMLWAAAASLNRDVFWWQDDYHHFKGFSSENYLPYTCSIAAVLNQKGLETVLEKNPKAEIFLRKQIQVKELTAIPEYPKVGIATNAFFEANSSQTELLIRLKRFLKIDKFKIRLHPNSKLKQSNFPYDLVEIAPIDENIDDFANSIDLAIVGNTAVQLKLLCEGVPILHIPGLDHYEFDTYGYCKLGFTFGTEQIPTLNLKEIKDFYLNPEIQKKLIQYVSVLDTSNCMSLEILG